MVEIVGNAGNCKTLNVCQSTARENAQRAYVENISSKIRGASTGHLTSRQTNDAPTDSEQTVNLFQRKFGAEIGRAMMIRYGVWRNSFSGGLEYQIVYLIDGGMAEQSAEVLGLAIAIRSLSRFYICCRASAMGEWDIA